VPGTGGRGHPDDPHGAIGLARFRRTLAWHIARRAFYAAAQASAFAGSIRIHRQARDILGNPALNVYDNERSFLMCVYNRERALCHRLDFDIRMPGIEATHLITTGTSTARVVVPTTFDDDDYVYGALRAGASGFLVKDSISVATAKTYLTRLLAKLDARDRVQLVILAYEAGLVAPFYRAGSLERGHSSTRRT
jgi:hypothetical protein